MMQPVTVVIPVYNAFDDALVCVRSVLRHSGRWCRVLVLDDCSPQGVLRDWLPEGVRRDPRLEVLRNEENLGFVGTCNRGMRLAAPQDVVLLNSDTEVTARWLEKMQQAAYADPRTGTVTPLTNHGEICSVPQMGRANSLPGGYSLEEFADLVERVSARDYPRLPTCVGFCVYLKREMLDRVGLFDQRQFSPGYGEENDLSLRAQAAGYVDRLDDATFIHHRGSSSFGPKGRRLSKRHMRTLLRRYPGYRGRVRQFYAANPLSEVHRRIHRGLLERWLAAARYTLLHVLHNPPLTRPEGRHPGGTEYHVADLIRGIPEAAQFSLCVTGETYRLAGHLPGCDVPLRLAGGAEVLRRLLEPGLFDVVHVHHAGRFPADVLVEALQRHGSYFVSLHDFGLACPRNHLVTPAGRFCEGRECTRECRQNGEAIACMRAHGRRLLQGARAVFHFSRSTRDILSSILETEANWQLTSHGTDRTGCAAELPEPPRPSAEQPLEVALLGAINVAKGARLIRRVVRHVRLPSGIPVRWHLIGMIEGGISRGMVCHGAYQRKELPSILAAVAPHLVAILSVVPETYCYTLDEAVQCGVPVVCTPLGAPAEKVRRLGCGWVFDELNPEGILRTLQSIVDHWPEYLRVRAGLPGVSLPDVAAMARGYDDWYGRSATAAAGSGRARAADALFRLEARFPAPRTASQRLAGLVLGGGVNLLQHLGLDGALLRVAACVLPGGAAAVRKMGLDGVTARLAARVLPARVRTMIQQLRYARLQT